MTQTSIATAADYADAMFTARRALRWLVGILLLILLAQLALFFVGRYTNALPVMTAATTTAVSKINPKLLQYFTGLTTFVGVVVSFVLPVVLLILLMIMLVGRLIGVSRVTSALIWSLVLAALLFPWQTLLNAEPLNDVNFKIPGVLFTSGELERDVKFPTQKLEIAILKWARFVGFPVAALIVLLMVNGKSRRGLRMALGEDQVVEVMASEETIPLEDTGPSSQARE